MKIITLLELITKHVLIKGRLRKLKDGQSCRMDVILVLWYYTRSKISKKKYYEFSSVNGFHKAGFNPAL